MTGPGAPRRGRHASPDDGTGALPPWGAPPPGAARPDGRWGEPPTPYDNPPARPDGGRWAGSPADSPGRPTPASRRRSGLLDRYADATGPLPGPEWRHGAADPAEPDDRPQHPSAPLPPLPSGTWSRLTPRPDASDDAPTEAQQAMPAPRPAGSAGTGRDEDETEAHHLDPHAWEDETGGLEVIGAHVDEDVRRRRGRRRRDEDLHEDLHEDLLEGDRDDDPHADSYADHDDLRDGDLHDGDLPDDELSFVPYGRRRTRRRPVAIAVALLVFCGLVLGIVVGGQKLLGLFQAEDYSGQGTGTVQVRVNDGDTLSDIARSLVSAGVIASVGPFVDAAEDEPQATGIAAGVYQLHQRMSGAAALDLLLDPKSRLVSKVTVPEGLTAAETLQRIADATKLPLDDFKAALANPAALGLPAYANGLPEGFLFPATYEVQPGDSAADILSGMVARTTQALDQLQIPEQKRLGVLTEASLVQAEASSTEDMAKVARVLDNRLAANMPLQLDTTVNYANGKTGLTTSAQDRANPSPYNTYLHPGLPPGPIGNPGEDAIKAVLAPAAGDWLYFVVVDPDTGDTRFAVTAAEHQQNVLLFQQWLREHPGG